MLTRPPSQCRNLETLRPYRKILAKQGPASFKGLSRLRKEFCHDPFMAEHLPDRVSWNPDTITNHAMPALQSSFEPVQQIADVYNWNPV
jgi:hypothetical protein